MVNQWTPNPRLRVQVLPPVQITYSLQHSHLYNIIRLMEKQRHFWQYHTVPPSNKDLLLRVLLEPATKILVGASKPSHSWTWQKFPYPKNFQGYIVAGDHTAFSPEHFNTLSFLKTLSRFGWQQVGIIKLDSELLDPDRKINYWQYAYSPLYKNFLDRCNVAINPSETVRFLVGPRPLLIHGIGNDNQEIPLSITRGISRNDPRYSHLPIF